MAHKKTKRRNLFKSICTVVLIQLFIIWCFHLLLSNCKPPSLQETKKTTINVAHTFYTSALGGTYYIQSDADKYYFPNHGAFSEYSNSKLNNSIQIGDKIHISYFEDRWLLGFSRRNIIIEAYTDSEVYRTIGEYNESKKGLIPITVILFVLIESMFVGIVWTYFLLNKAYFKIKKKQKNK